MSTNQICLDRLEAKLGFDPSDPLDMKSLTHDEKIVLSLILAHETADDLNATAEERQAGKVQADKIEGQIRVMARKRASWLAYYGGGRVDYVPPVGGSFDCDFEWTERPDTLQRRHDLWALPEIRALVGDPSPTWLARSEGRAERALARFDALFARVNALAAR
jgi:hypothetical protein